MKKISWLLLSLTGLVACNGGSSGSSSGGGTVYPQNPTNSVGPNNSYQCLPSNLPLLGSVENNLKIAYGSNCQVANVEDSTIQSSLESMAVAITVSTGQRYCTGTPLSYNPDTGVGYVLSAAHCVVGNSKAANQQITANNIVTFTNSRNYINQTLNATAGSDTTGTIQAVYVPQQYCTAPAFNAQGECSDLAAQNGDFALLKVQVNPTPGLNVNPQVRLAASNLTLPYPSYIMALGYGITNTNGSNTNLFYITYEYFATNSYQGEVGQSVIMNGYSPYMSNMYYSIICGGDSGGGDFYWDGTYWNLVGAHSYGSSECGSPSSSYPYVNPFTKGANDVSADVRLFSNQLTSIMTTDTASSGCNESAAANNSFVCASGG